MGRSSNSNLGAKILLYIFGIALVITAVIVLLRGFGILTAIPGYVIWALVLITVGFGIIGGLRSTR